MAATTVQELARILVKPKYEEEFIRSYDLIQENLEEIENTIYSERIAPWLLVRDILNRLNWPNFPLGHNQTQIRNILPIQDGQLTMDIIGNYSVSLDEVIDALAESQSLEEYASAAGIEMEELEETIQWELVNIRRAEYAQKALRMIKDAGLLSLPHGYSIP